MGVRLVSFAVHWIRAEIHEYVLRNWRLVRIATTKAQRKLFFNLRRLKRNLSWLSAEETRAVAKDLGVPAAEVTEMEQRLAAHDLSFDPLPAGRRGGILRSRGLPGRARRRPGQAGRGRGLGRGFLGPAGRRARRAWTSAAAPSCRGAGWPAPSAAGRYRHSWDRWAAPLDPNFSGAGRCLTDAEGRYSFTTIKPGPYPWGNHYNAWRPAHIHFSLMGRAFIQRLVTQMYFPGDPFFPYDPVFNSVRDSGARGRMISSFSIHATQPNWAVAYEFDIYLRGPAATPIEEAH